MKRTARILLTIGSLFAAGIASAGEKTVTIEVSGLYCSSCPYIAAQAISGIESAEITDGFYDAQAELAQFVIRYDDEVTTTDALLGATVKYGYPAKLVPDDNS